MKKMIEETRITDKVLIGDHPAFGRKLYWYRVNSQEDAQAMVDLLTDRLHLGHVKVVFTNMSTKHRYGLFYTFRNLMKIHKIGQNEGTIIYELSHVVERRHGRLFQAMQLRLKEVWERG
jgi:hypothetical protein